MAGVEVLSTAEVIVKSGFYWPALILPAIVGGAAMGTAFWFSDRVVEVAAYFTVLGVLTGMLLGIVPAILLGDRDNVYETQYKVVVSEEVSMSEFLDTYEIVDQDGKILVVRERVNENMDG